MNTKYKITLIGILMCGCSPKIERYSPFTPLPVQKQTLRTSDDLVNGTVDGTPWKMGNIIAKRNLDGSIMVTIADERMALHCSKWVGNLPHILFSVPPSIHRRLRLRWYPGASDEYHQYGLSLHVGPNRRFIKSNCKQI